MQYETVSFLPYPQELFIPHEWDIIAPHSWGILIGHSWGMIVPHEWGTKGTVLSLPIPSRNSKKKRAELRPPFPYHVVLFASFSSVLSYNNFSCSSIGIFHDVDTFLHV